MPKILHLKQSGEMLTTDPSMRWTPDGLRTSAEQIAELHGALGHLGLDGVMVISGGGNTPDGFGRGANTRQKFGSDSAVNRAADVIGRRSTTDNAIMLAAALEDVGVPYMLVAAPNSGFEDGEIGEVPAYTPQLVQEAYRLGKVVLIAGGAGRGGEICKTSRY